MFKERAKKEYKNSTIKFESCFRHKLSEAAGYHKWDQDICLRCITETIDHLENILREKVLKDKRSDD